MRRVPRALLLAILGLLVLAPAAVAGDNPTGGQGILGENNDKMITYASFIIIAVIPLFVWLMSRLQSRLEKRKAARKASAKALQGSPDARGGW